jgi:hypothetical protein
MEGVTWFDPGQDRQFRNQAVLVTTRQEIDLPQTYEWSENECPVNAIMGCRWLCPCL